MKNKIPTQLAPFIDARRAIGHTTREGLKLVLDDAKQPLTVLEIRRATEQLVDRKIDGSQVRIILNELQNSGLVSTRTETVEERNIRANGNPSRGYNATLFWAHGKRVPARTVTEAIPGFVLQTKNKTRSISRGPGRPKGSKNKSKKTSGLVDSNFDVTVEVSAFIEKLVKHRTAELQARIEELENKLTVVKTMLV